MKTNTLINPEEAANNFKALIQEGLSKIFEACKIYVDLIDQSVEDAEKFRAGEVFTIRSEGNGAGEFDKIQQPTMEGFGKTGDHPAQWEPEGSGDVFSAWKRRSSLLHAVVEQKIILHHQLKRIDFEISLLNWECILFG